MPGIHHTHRPDAQFRRPKIPQQQITDVVNIRYSGGSDFLGPAMAVQAAVRPIHGRPRCHFVIERRRGHYFGYAAGINAKTTVG